MRTIYLDDGTRLDDPNAYWGDPSYLLELGDPGYVPPAPTQPTRMKRKRMATRNNYYPTRADSQVTWNTNFRNKLPNWATILGLAAGVVPAAQADCDWLNWLIGTWLPAVRTFSESCTDTIAEAQTGLGTTPLVPPTFTPPAGATATNPGALTRIFTLVQEIRINPACTDLIASDLGIVGSEQGPPDFNTFAPILKLTRAPAGVTVGWGWQGKSAFPRPVRDRS